MKAKILRYSAPFLAAVATAAGLSLSGCHPIEEFESDLYGNFDALWTILDEHYCFFEEKGIDWTATGEQYRARIKPDMKQTEFFDLCAGMLAELRDGHVNLSSFFNTSYYRNWWSDYPEDFDWRLIQEYYLDWNYSVAGGVSYKLLEDKNVGYMRYGSFASPVGDSMLDVMMLSFKDSDGLIIDIRDNGGGDMTNVEKLVSRFITEKTLAGYIIHKTGPGHNDFSEPYAYYFNTAEGHVRWLKPVVVLMNRSTFSAANNFVSIMQYLPQVLTVGTRTGGGSGIPFSSELPNGWSIRFSASPVLDPEKKATESGIDPAEGCTISMDPEQARLGRDTMLDFAIELLNKFAEEKEKS